MSTLSSSLPNEQNRVQRLVNGERMTQAEFHRCYERCGEDEKWELVGGIVYMASPLRRKHSRYDDEIGYILGSYRRQTPGTEVLHNATTILDDNSEPQPDLGLRILSEYGGQSWTTPDDYVAGAPELVVEIANSKRDLAMHGKRDDYQRTGVVEYLVVCMEERELHWYHFPSGKTIPPNREGIVRSRVFPGLWLDAAALLRLDSARLVEVLQRGVAGREHTAFVKRLQAAHRKRDSQ